MTYPASISTLADKSDGPGNIIYAAHVNSIHTALRDLRTLLGDDPEGNLANVETRLDAIVDNDGYRVLPANFRMVGKSGAKYTTIQSAIDSISDQSDSKPYTVLIFPGIYAEVVTTKANVHLAALCPGSVTVTAPSEQTALEHYGGNIFGINFFTDIGENAANFQTTVYSYIYCCSFYADTGRPIDFISGNAYLFDCRLTATIQYCFYITAGYLEFNHCRMITINGNLGRIIGGSGILNHCVCSDTDQGIECNTPGVLIARLNRWANEPWGSGTINLGTMKNTNCNFV